MKEETEKSSQEEMLERQLARCAEALDACLDGAMEAREKKWQTTREQELHDAAKLMGASARLAGALARLRGGTSHTVRVERGDTPTKNRGSNGPANR